MATLYRVPTQNSLQYTLDSQLAAGGTTLTLNQSVTGLVQAPGVLTIDRVDSSSNKTPTKREYISFTGVSGANLTGLTRGLAGSTDQVHSVGAIVEFTPDVVQEEALYGAITTEHSATGTHTGITASTASLVIGNVRQLSVPSLASIRDLYITNYFNASGASLAGLAPADLTVTNSFTVSGASLRGFPIRPVWVISGNTSSASTSIGKPLDMPESGTIEWASVVLRSPVSGASLLFDINKNFTSIFTDQNTRLSILGGGTFVSTASIGTKIFSRGDVFSIDLDAGGNFSDATIKISAR